MCICRLGLSTHCINVYEFVLVCMRLHVNVVWICVLAFAYMRFITMTVCVYMNMVLCIKFVFIPEYLYYSVYYSVCILRWLYAYNAYKVSLYVYSNCVYILRCIYLQRYACVFRYTVCEYMLSRTFVYVFN